MLSAVPWSDLLKVVDTHRICFTEKTASWHLYWAFNPWIGILIFCLLVINTMIINNIINYLFTFLVNDNGGKKSRGTYFITSTGIVNR